MVQQTLVATATTAARETYGTKPYLLPERTLSVALKCDLP